MVESCVGVDVEVIGGSIFVFREPRVVGPSIEMSRVADRWSMAAGHLSPVSGRLSLASLGWVAGCRWVAVSVTRRWVGRSLGCWFGGLFVTGSV